MKMRRSTVLVGVILICLWAIIGVAQDTDGDGLLDYYETHTDPNYRYMGITDPNNPDTDGDGLNDCQEVYGLDNLRSGDSGDETDPTVADTDNDGVWDYYELFTVSGYLYMGITDPNNPDTDGDGLLDGEEIEGLDTIHNNGDETDPTNVDTDNDGIWDYFDVELFSPSKRYVMASPFMVTPPDVVFGWGELDPLIPKYGDLGIHLYTAEFMDLKTQWLGIGQYSWGSCGNFLDRLASYDPDAKIFVRVKLRVPEWWRLAHKQEMMITIVEDEPEYRRLYASYSSTQWLSDTATALTNFITYLQSHPEGDRVVGIRIGGGSSNEWYYSSKGFSDYSNPQQNAFRAWLQEKYVTDAALQAAWNNPSITLQTFYVVPMPSLRDTGDFYEFFNPTLSRQVLDYQQFHSEKVADTISYFAQVIKTADPDLLVGTYYGYHFPLERHYHDAGHNALQRLLQDPNIDIIASPHAYTNRGAGDGITSMVPMETVKIHDKLFFDEDDTRTYLATRDDDFYLANGAETLNETINVLKRDFGFTLSKGLGIWFLDWAKGWYKDADLHNLLGDQMELGRNRIMTGRLQNNVEIALVVSEQSPDYICASSAEGVATGVLRSLYRDLYGFELPRIGAPYDIIQIDDIGSASDYKLYIFLDIFYISTAQKTAVHNKLANLGATALWMFGPGYVTDSGFSVTAMADLTGITLGVKDGAGHQKLLLTNTTHAITSGVPSALLVQTVDQIGPIFHCNNDPQAVVLGETQAFDDAGNPVHDENDWVGFVKKDIAAGWKSIWCGVPVLPTMLLRNIAIDAGVHIYSNADDIVYANDFMVSVHARSAGTREISLPGQYRIIDAFSGIVYSENDNKINVTFQLEETRIWLLEPVAN